MEVDDRVKAARSFLSSKNMFLLRGDLVIVFCLTCGRLLMSRKYIFLVEPKKNNGDEQHGTSRRNNYTSYLLSLLPASTSQQFTSSCPYSYSSTSPQDL